MKWLKTNKIYLALFLISLTYFEQMFVEPIYYTGWIGAQQVWYKWQSLNVGILAFLASITALYRSRIQAVEQKKRDFIAAKAFLPEALSELIRFYRDCANLWESIAKEIPRPTFQEQGNTTLCMPNLPQNYRQIFKECIHSSEPNIGNRLAEILNHLQVHNARLSNFIDGVNQNKIRILRTKERYEHLLYLSELAAYTLSLFEFARNIEEFSDRKFSRDDIVTAMSNINISIEIQEQMIDLVKKKYP